MDLELPDHLASGQRELIVGLAERNHSEHGDGLLGLVLSGSAARGMATERSDLDMYVVLTDDAAHERRTDRSAAVDEIPVALSELEKVPPVRQPGVVVSLVLRLGADAAGQDRRPDRRGGSTPGDLDARRGRQRVGRPRSAGRLDQLRLQVA